MALVEPGAYQPAKPRRSDPMAVPELGGEVLVRGLMLSERLANDALHRKESRPLAGETEEDAHARAGAIGVPRVLARCVLGAGDKPVMSENDWDAFGGDHPLIALRLFNVAIGLSGVGFLAESELEKN